MGHWTKWVKAKAQFLEWGVLTAFDLFFQINIMLLFSLTFFFEHHLYYKQFKFYKSVSKYTRILISENAHIFQALSYT